MKLHRFFVDKGAVQEKKINLTDVKAISQIKKVLRLGVGDPVVFLDNTGKEYFCRIVESHVGSLISDVETVKENVNEPELKIALYQSLCKKDKFEWVLQKGTEIGVSAFIPIVAERSEKLGFDAERARKIIKEAAEQSKRGRLPYLLDVADFETAMKDTLGEKLVLDASGGRISEHTFIIKTEIGLFVGPEGGWSERELEIARAAGAKIVSLGNRLLRTETAGVVATAVILNS